jgi:leader peptidase (prepilin peptidase)/N-methyltransferase
MDASLVFALGLMGFVVGSFVGLVTVRLPAGEPVALGRSRCPACRRTLGARDLVPVLSWLALRGRCRTCGAAISTRHSLIELGAGAIGTLAGMAGNPTQAALLALFGWVLLALAILDAEHLWLPNRITLPLAAVGLAASFAPSGMGLFDSFAGAVAGYAGLVLVAALYRRLRGRVGLGGGDPTLLGAIGAWTGWQALPYVLLLAALGGLTIALVLILLRRVDRTTRLPFGSFLAAAGWLVLAAQVM